VVWTSPVVPDREGGGSERRIAHLLLELATTASVHLVAPGAPTDDAVVAALSSIEVVPPVPWALPTAPLLRRAWDVRWALRGPRREIALGAPWRERAAVALAGRLDEVRPGVVLLDHPTVAPLVAARTARAEPWVLTLHNLGSELAAHEAAVVHGRRQRWLLARERTKSLAFERWSLDAFDAVVCVSPDDATRMPGPVAMVPNGVDCDAIAATPLPPEPVVVFTAALHTAPNIDGIRWFVASIWPRIVGARPDARLDIVGARPSPEVLALGGGAVRVHADVPSTEAFLRRSRVAVVPLRIGSGSRLKVLEAMAAGRPVVGTTIGLGGLSVRGGADALSADDPDAFADAVVRVLDDDEAAGRLALRGPAFVHEHGLCWSDVAPRFARLVRDLATRGS
jgi:glycosyltransferase involved in cell wall biosynthesis